MQSADGAVSIAKPDSEGALRSLEFGPTWPNILSVVPFESQGSQEEFKSYKPFVHLCCALAHSFIESGLAERIPSSVSIFRCLLGSK